MSQAIICPVVERRNRSLEEVISPMAMARTALGRPDTNFFILDGESIDFPATEWGRDFEVRLLLDRRRPSTLRKVMSALPKRFENDRVFWAEYLQAISQKFCDTFGVRHSMLRFSQVSNNQCSLFHTDNVVVRLFQTICGPGTEYILNEHVNRDGIGSGCNSKIVIDSTKIQHVREKDIFLMRGDKWVDRKGLVHRSPPIEHLGLKRLYLCLDAIDDPTIRYC